MMNRMTTRAFQLLLLSGSASTALAQWSVGQWQAERLGYFDAVHTRADGQQQSIIRGQRIDRGGLVVGISERYTGESFSGQSAWASLPGQPLIRVGFTDAIHTNTDGDQFSDLGGAVGLAADRRGSINALGQTIGTSTRFNGPTESGQSAWRWDPVLGTQQLGPVSGELGATFVDTTGAQFSVPVSLNNAGRVIGYSVRYPEALLGGQQPATSAWLQQPGTAPIILDLPGSQYIRPADDYRRHEPRFITNTGVVTGYSFLFDALSNFLGQDAWVWDSTLGTRRIGPSGSRYAGPDGRAFAIATPTDAGDVFGTSSTFFETTTDSGRDAWIVRAGEQSVQIIGLTGPDHTRADGLQQNVPLTYVVDGPLRIAGAARLFLDLGNPLDGGSAWSWTPSEGNLEIGLRDSEHETPTGQRNSAPLFMLPSGHVAGLADKLDGSIFGIVGQSAWVWAPATASTLAGQTRRVGVVDALHTSSDGFQRSEIYGFTPSGYFYGVSYRYNGRPQADIGTGRTVWVYDTRTGVQTNLVFSQSSTGDAAALPLTMSDDGTLGGYYLEYSGTQIVAQRAFVWSPQRGVSTVNALLAGGPGAQQIENAFFTDLFEPSQDAGLIYAMPQGVLWSPEGGGWATAYRLRRTGVTACSPADIGGAGQTVGADGQLTADDIIVYIGWYFATDARADIAGSGQSVGADGQFTADDLIVFINRFFAGC